MAISTATPEYTFDIPATKAALLSALVRQNFNALGSLNLTTDAAYPPNPRQGLPRILATDITNVKLQLYLNGAWTDIIQHLESTDPVPHKVIVAVAAPGAAAWTIDHNIGSRVIAQAYDGAWNLLSPTAVQQPTVNRVTFNFAGAQWGFAVCIG